MEAQIESMRGNILALKNQPGKEKKKEKKKKDKPPTGSTSKASGSRAPKAANGAVKKKSSKKQLPDDDILTFDQKKDLSEAITKLDGSRLEKVINIIHEGVPEIRDVRRLVCFDSHIVPNPYLAEHGGNRARN